MNHHQDSDPSKRKRRRPDLSRVNAESYKKGNTAQTASVDSKHLSEPDNQPEKNLLSRGFDQIISGGLSLFIAITVISLGWFSQSGVGSFLYVIEVYLLTDLLINGPHFMASYRLLYSRRENFRKHPGVTIIFPFAAIIFLSYIIYSSYRSEAFDPLGIMGILTVIAPILLGWHYVGQSWGATACFAFLSGFRIAPRERTLIRGGILTLFIYHIAWFYNDSGFIQTQLIENEAGTYLMLSVMSLCRLLVGVGFIAGLFGFWQLARESGRSIPMRIWLPWVATFSWYVMVDLQPASVFLLQIFHAFQYLMFPLRVELNDYTPKRNGLRHLVLYYLLLVIFGFLAFDWHTFDAVPKQLIPAGTATLMIINLHHYFIDAVIWKIRKPEVRESLFGHLKPGTSGYG